MQNNETINGVDTSSFDLVGSRGSLVFGTFTSEGRKVIFRHPVITTNMISNFPTRLSVGHCTRSKSKVCTLRL